MEGGRARGNWEVERQWAGGPARLSADRQDTPRWEGPTPSTLGFPLPPSRPPSPFRFWPSPFHFFQRSRILSVMLDSASADSARGQQPAAPKRQLTLFDSTCIIVGIIIGAGIYESTPLIASSLPSVGWLVGAWLLGGLFSLIGALCYAELATAYPREGGDYVYLTRAFGRAPGFLFAWAQLWVVRPGSIGAMAYVFARYANRLWPLSSPLASWYRTGSVVPADPKVLEDLFTYSERFGVSIALIVYAAAAIAILTVINIVGVREGKWTQNLLTIVKVLGLAAIFVIGMFFSTGDATIEAPADPGKQVESDQAAQPADKTSLDPGEEPGTEKAEPEKDDWRKFLAAFGFAMILCCSPTGAGTKWPTWGPRSTIRRRTSFGRWCWAPFR